MITFRHVAIQSAPPWLQRSVGARILYTIGVHFDALITLTELSLMARYPDHTPVDGLAMLGRDRKIQRGFSEPAKSYASRLNNWLIDRKQKGSPYAMMRQLCGYMTGYTPTVWVAGNTGSWSRLTPTQGGNDMGHGWHLATWDYDGNLGHFWRYWIIINMPEGLWTNDGIWGSGDSP